MMLKIDTIPFNILNQVEEHCLNDRLIYFLEKYGCNTGDLYTQYKDAAVLFHEIASQPKIEMPTLTQVYQALDQNWLGLKAQIKASGYHPDLIVRDAAEKVGKIVSQSPHNTSKGKKDGFIELIKLCNQLNQVPLATRDKAGVQVFILELQRALQQFTKLAAEREEMRMSANKKPTLTQISKTYRQAWRALAQSLEVFSHDHENIAEVIPMLNQAIRSFRTQAQARISRAKKKAAAEEAAKAAAQAIIDQTTKEKLAAKEKQG